MEPTWKPPAPGALDDTPWAEQLTARAVERVDGDDRLHGYAVLGDLAKFYRFTDTLYLALTGELPDERASALFDLALQSWSTPSPAEAPVHLAILTRSLGAPQSSALATALVSAADQARAIVEAHASLVSWLETPQDDPPATFRSADIGFANALATAATRIAADQQLVRAGMTRDAARIALLYLAGVRAPEQMQSAIVTARICGISAEALATGPEHLAVYPVKLPPFCYVED